jgi:hypothetical protein
MELRLERSFERENLLDEALVLAYGERAAALILLIATAINGTGQGAGSLATFGKSANNWPDDPYAYDQVVKGVNVILESYRPQGSPTPPVMTSTNPVSNETRDLAPLFENVGIDEALTLISGVARGKPSSSAHISVVSRICKLLEGFRKPVVPKERTATPAEMKILGGRERAP